MQNQAMTSTTGTDSDATAHDIEQIVVDLFAAAERGDWDTFRAAFTPDARLRQNIGKDHSIDDAMLALPRLTEDGTTLRYENAKRAIAPNVVTEMHDAVFTKPDGREVRIDICIVVELNDDGLIVRADEYLDSNAAAQLFAP